jgi:UDP-glucuronate decarboxylase
MKILVTGGAGFLGSHLTRRLIREGHRVVVLDNLQTGDLDNLADLLPDERLTFVWHDVVEPYDLDDVDRIYNLACAASPPRYQEDPVHTILTNVLGMRHALELAERTGARILQASTSEVYGDPEVHPQPEDYRGSVNPHGPRACYDEGKRCAEALCADFHRSRHVDVRIARIFNTYGPAMGAGDGRVVVNFVMQAISGTPLTIYGDGDQTRSLCYVDDLLDGLQGLMERTTFTGPVNLGNPSERTVREIAELVLARLPGSDLVYCPLPADDPQRRRPDITLAGELFGFEPRVSFESGLERTIEDLRARSLREGARRAG